MSIFIVCSVDW